MNPLTPLTQLANGLPNLLASVSSRLESYFSEQSRFQPQFLFPTLGFLLGCLGLVMGLLTPGAPRAWWDGLNADVKLLFLALLFLLFILVEAISSNLVLLIRRLYSGEWLQWWQRPGRQRFLAERLAREAEQRQLQIAQDTLIRAERQLKAANSAPGGDSAEKPARYPVLRVSLPAYQLIGPGDWVWQEAPAAANVALSPADIVGCYTLTALAAGQPIPLDKLNTLPRADYLAPTRRQILTLSLYVGDDNPALKPGDPFNAQIAPRQGQPAIFPDLLLLDRLPDHRWVVSAPAAQAGDLVQHLAAAHNIAIWLDVQAAQQRLTALPTAAQALAPGQLIQADDFAWQPCQLVRRDQTWFVAPDIPLDSVITQAKQLIDATQGYYFWPQSFDVGAPPSNLSPIKCPGAVFLQDEVKSIADRAWLTFTDALGKTVSRRAYWLPGPTVVERLPVVTGDRLVVTSPVAGSAPTLLETWAFVYHKPAAGYFLAVKDPITFDTALAGAALIELSPFTEVPVLNVTRQPGDLIDAAQVVVAPYRANDASLIGNRCLEVTEVVDHYVRANGAALVAGKPIPRARLGQTYPADYVAVDLARARTPSFAAGVQRGDLVSLVIEHPLGKIPRSAVFVASADFDAAAKVFTRLSVPLPPDLAAQANALLPNATVTVEVSHSDAGCETDLSALESATATARASALNALNETLSAGDPDEAALVERAEELLVRVKELTDLNQALSERPWGVGRTAKGENWYVAARRRQLGLANDLRDIVANWRVSVQQILLNRQQGARLTLPDNLAETRPTGLGNILAAAAEYPLTAYGIHTPTILPRLLQALTVQGSADPVVTRLVNAENALNMLLLFSFWAGVWTLLGALLFIVLGVVWWLWPVVLLGGPLAWWLTKEGAEAQAYAYGDALKALFDQRRRVLFESLNLTLPDAASLDLTEERRYWRYLYQLFAYGQVDPDFPAIKLAKEKQDA